METKTVEATIGVLREELGFRALVEAGPFTPTYGRYRGQDLTVQRWPRVAAWKITFPPVQPPAFGFSLATRDSRQGWGDLLQWGRSAGLGDPALDERFVLRSWSREPATALFAQQRVRSLLHAAVPCLYRWQVSSSLIQLSYREQPGPPRESVVAMLDHALALTES